MLVKKVKVTRRKFYSGVVNILVTFNNSLISITDKKGNLIVWSSSGLCGFKGSRKSTPFATQTATELAMKKAMELGLKQVQIKLCGPGMGREIAVRTIQNLGVAITSIKDVTALPHNGCRPPKKRRV